ALGPLLRYDGTRRRPLKLGKALRATPGMEVDWTGKPWLAAAATIQSVSTPPPSPPNAATRIDIGRNSLLSFAGRGLERGAVIVALNSRPCRLTSAANLPRTAEGEAPVLSQARTRVRTLGSRRSHPFGLVTISARQQ